jgi:hypothetical protein
MSYKRKTKHGDEDSEDDDEPVPRRRSTRGAAAAEAEESPSADWRERQYEHALTINTDNWTYFPFCNVPIDVNVHLVNITDDITHGFEVAFGVDLVFSDDYTSVLILGFV